MVQKLAVEERQGLRALALRAHAEALVVGEMQRRQAFEQQRQVQLDRISYDLQRLGLDVVAQDDPCEVDGLWFSHDHGFLCVILACPLCHERFDHREVGSLEHLGSLLAEYGEGLIAAGMCYSCFNQQEEVAEEWTAAMPPPTTEERFIAALDELVRARVRELLG